LAAALVAVVAGRDSPANARGVWIGWFGAVIFLTGVKR
jgi:hypothetical protein